MPLIVKSIRWVAVVSSRGFDRLVLVFKRLSFLDIRWRQQVAVVIDGTGLCDSPFHHVGAEIVAVAQIGESDDVIFCFTVADERYTRYDFDSKALCKERALLGIHLAKLRFDVLRCQNAQMFVDNLATLGCVAIEMTNNILRLLRHLKELFLVDQLRIFTVSLKAIEKRCN